jgi:UDP-N-acetyl-D-galactosamine dehydrogenase
LDDIVIGVVGLGYVGLPLAAAFSRHFPVIGQDINAAKIEKIRRGEDPTNEVGPALKDVKAEWTTDPSALKRANFITVCVPTPVTAANVPDLSPVENAARYVGQNLQPGSIIVLESTVYPGVTEEVMGPIIARESGLARGAGFTLGYSPERINPGDKEHTLERMPKVVAGDDIDTIAAVYGRIVQGVHRAPTIKTAEMSKVIENSQRDINIAFANEVSRLCHLFGIDFQDVRKAAKTKWNYLDFQPGLVGGHCIGVDPYYLSHRAQELGYHTRVILAGREVNDEMPHHVSRMVLSGLNELGRAPKDSRIGILGLTFKENINDYRNSKVATIIEDLKSLRATIYADDPHLDFATAQREFGVPLIPPSALKGTVDAVVVAVAHDAYRKLALDDIAGLCRGPPVLIDVKGIYDKDEAARKGIQHYRL